MFGVASSLHGLETGQALALGRAGTTPLNGGAASSQLLARGRWREPAKPSSRTIAALDPAFPNQQHQPPGFADFQWPLTSRVGRGQGETEREVKAGAKERWSKHNESALSGDTPLPLSLAFPGTEPASKKEMDAMLNCNPELEDCKDPVYQWTAKCTRCQGTGEVSFYRKRGKEVISTCIACTGTGYVQRITYRADKVDGSDLS